MEEEEEVDGGEPGRENLSVAYGQEVEEIEEDGEEDEEGEGEDSCVDEEGEDDVAGEGEGEEEKEEKGWVCRFPFRWRAEKQTEQRISPHFLHSPSPSTPHSTHLFLLSSRA